MKLSFVALATLPLAALAAPANGDYKEDKHADKYESDKHADKYEDDKSWDKGYSGKDKSNLPFPFFTSTFTAEATPDTIVSADEGPVPGLPGGSGLFKFYLNSKDDVICYDINVYIKGDYESPAVTATHIHEAPAGEAGPPRLAFPNPSSDAPLDVFSWRSSAGCMQGPFKTGVTADDGSDTADGFTISQLEENPSAFFADTHTVEYVAGAIRDQLA